MQKTYLTTNQLADRIGYDARTVRERLKDTVLIEGRHYFRPFGRRKILYIWETVEKDMLDCSESLNLHIPMSNGGLVHV